MNILQTLNQVGSNLHELHLKLRQFDGSDALWECLTGCAVLRKLRVTFDSGPTAGMRPLEGAVFAPIPQLEDVLICNWRQWGSTAASRVLRAATTVTLQDCTDLATGLSTLAEGGSQMQHLKVRYSKKDRASARCSVVSLWNSVVQHKQLMTIDIADMTFKVGLVGLCQERRHLIIFLPLNSPTLTMRHYHP